MAVFLVKAFYAPPHHHDGQNGPVAAATSISVAQGWAAEHAQFARAAAQAAEATAAKEKARAARLAELREEYDLATASNAVIALVRAGKLDEAEAAARELLVRFPEVHDGYDRLGLVYEAGGQNNEPHLRQPERIVAIVGVLEPLLLTCLRRVDLLNRVPSRGQTINEPAPVEGAFHRDAGNFSAIGLKCF